MSTLIEKIASDEVIDKAYQWLCQKREHYHPNADVWQVRRWWHEKKPLIQGQIRSGHYQFRELRLIRGKEESNEWWSSMDALVLKAITIVLTEHLKPVLSPLCFHLAGHGGLKGAVREVAENLSENTFVFRTDVKSYYASINHSILMEIVGKYVTDEAVLCLLWGYLRRYVSDGGNYIDITEGISLGCPLSPLIGALFLKPLDDRMAQLGSFYVRYMDDWVILAPTRWKLRKAIKATNQVMNELKVIKHPDKTKIGRIARGFDFLGYWFSPAGLGIARKTVERMVENVARLYEHGAPIGRIEAYFQRWWRWVKGGISVKRLSVIRRSVTQRVMPCT
ncbi:reverse transcriptase/maturase family protein [Moorena producens JHB]|uniref:Reverse transcriptase/maturase family protein n=1 Tax=Moorena producens (strain JHB) TaxID=1454205 RepID=A0A9Q9UVJ2_MOOP1|nr:reverse transcriptase/maturase family protein [Moorena producens]WAN68866.1 reverse transcriptase/maturase family protein [Moorena producens JHB]